MYTELQTTTNFSFLRGASHVQELFAAASLLGIPALGITDRGSLAGIVRAHKAAEETNTRLIVGTRLDLTDGPSVLVYPTDHSAYAALCRLLSIGKSRAGKGACDLTWADLAAAGRGMIAVLNSPPTPEILQRLKADFADRAYLALTLRRRPNDAVRLHQEAELARQARVPTVATGDVLYHAPGRHILADVLTCIREGRTIDEIGHDRDRSADRHLKPPEEMARLFVRHPDAIARTMEIADRCQFSLKELRYQYPHEVHIPGLTAQQTLERLTWESIPSRYPNGAPDDVIRQLRHELDLIAELEYAPYFLTVHAIVRYARSEKILCQGRGSAANSAVCYVLGITEIDPVRSNLLFERFLSTDRREPPDIDVDFEHERREEVIQWIYETYGRHRAALCATVIRYRGRGAVRDVGKVMGLPEDVTAALSAQISHWGSDGLDNERAAELKLNLDDRRLRLTIDLARSLIGFPRHLSQHPGGFVLTEDRLDDLVPIEPAAMKDRQVVEWDKDDIDTLRFMKVDVLGLGMLGCLRRAFDLIEQRDGKTVTIASIPAKDTATFDMICKADTLGTFQIESRAQMSMLPRLKPRIFYDIVIQVAIVRPGPIQGDMVHPYLRRRDGIEKVEYPTPQFRHLLEKTLGVPLFQEQAMQIALVCAGFDPKEADALRRSMATFKAHGAIVNFHEKMINGMMNNGYTREFAEQTVTRIEGFGSYGFPESHAASFALLAYASSWLKCHHPDVFCCALLNAQPMGFYAPAQIVRDAEAHGVEIRPVCVNASIWDCTLEQNAVRLGFRMVLGLAEKHAQTIIDNRATPYRSIPDLHRRAVVPVSALERLAEADAFRALNQGRRQAVWAIRGLSNNRLPLFDHADSEANEPEVNLPAMTEGRQVVEDYHSVRLSLRGHPVSFLRATLSERRITRCADLVQRRDGTRLTVAGIVLVRQRPGSANGVIFVTIEDETGIANLIVWPSAFEKWRRVLLTARMLACRGKMQKESGVIHVVADEITDLSDLLRSVGDETREIRQSTRDFR